jgi:hypothetical protein
MPSGSQTCSTEPGSVRAARRDSLASQQELEDAEDKTALADWRAREAAGQTSYVTHDEALRRLGLAG